MRLSVLENQNLSDALCATTCRSNRKEHRFGSQNRGGARPHQCSGAFAVRASDVCGATTQSAQGRDGLRRDLARVIRSRGRSGATKLISHYWEVVRTFAPRSSATRKVLSKGYESGQCKLAKRRRPYGEVKGVAARIIEIGQFRAGDESFGFSSSKNKIARMSVWNITGGK